MKFVALTSAALLAASTAFAGNLNTDTSGGDDVTIVDNNDEQLAGGSLAWIIPVVAIALVAGVIASDDDD